MTAAPTGVRLWLLVATPLIAQFAFAGAAAGILQATGAMSSGTTLTSLPQALVVLASYAVFGGATLVVARAFGPPAEVLALRRLPLRRGVLLAAVGLGAGVAIAVILEPVFHGQASQRIDAGAVTGAASAIALVLSLIAIVGAAAVLEELYFRGLLYGRLDERLGTASAVVGSAGVFGLVHFEPNAFPVLFGLGLVLGVLRWRTASVWPGVGVHAANNALAAIGILLTSS